VSPPAVDEQNENQAPSFVVTANLRTPNCGWLPDDNQVIDEWRDNKIKQYALSHNSFEEAVEEKETTVHHVIQELYQYIVDNEIVEQLCKEMIQQNHRYNLDTKLGRVSNASVLLLTLNGIIGEEPQFVGKHLIGVPLAALFTGVNATLAGQQLFAIKGWNEMLTKVLKTWGDYLYSEESFPKDNSWLSEHAQSHWNKPPTSDPSSTVWIWPSAPNPHWKSWNDFFSRQINREYRPTAQPDNDDIICCANDGYADRWRDGVQQTAPFWIVLKQMPYSLTDVFGPDLDHYPPRFAGGLVFQTFLAPFSYHRWWAPVTGTIKTVAVIPGYYFSKRVLPDFSGATTASCPYLLEVNARGIVVIDTTGYSNIGMVACVPIGMVEVSSILFADSTVEGAVVQKGDEIGHFAFGGSSSFAIIFENPAKYNKKMVFKADHDLGSGSSLFPKDPEAPSPTGAGIAVNAGMQIGVITSE